MSRNFRQQQCGDSPPLTTPQVSHVKSLTIMISSTGQGDAGNDGPKGEKGFPGLPGRPGPPGPIVALPTGGPDGGPDPLLIAEVNKTNSTQRSSSKISANIKLPKKYFQHMYVQLHFENR